MKNVFCFHGFQLRSRGKLDIQNTFANLTANISAAYIYLAYILHMQYILFRNVETESPTQISCEYCTTAFLQVEPGLKAEVT